jgi:FkbM family methyltransferase
LDYLKKTAKRVAAILLRIAEASTYYDSTHSYSQSGEDIIVEYVLNILGIHKPTYLDIGAHHPTRMNNTYLFYRKGSRGVCVEPDPAMYALLNEKRKRDICLNIGIGFEKATLADFHVMSANTLSTFSKDTAGRYQSNENQRIVRVIKVPLISLNRVLEKTFKRCPDFVSLDVEGLELETLKTFDFLRFRPPVFCIETLTYSENKTERKLTQIIDYMNEKNYMTYADTYINTIFVDAERWRKR